MEGGEEGGREEEEGGEGSKKEPNFLLETSSFINSHQLITHYSGIMRQSEPNERMSSKTPVFSQPNKWTYVQAIIMYNSNTFKRKKTVALQAI